MFMLTFMETCTVYFLGIFAVVLLTEAWIETVCDSQFHAPTAVVLLTEAWIETMIAKLFVVAKLVVLLTEAWIETSMKLFPQGEYRRRPPHGGVD